MAQKRIKVTMEEFDEAIAYFITKDHREFMGAGNRTRHLDCAIRKIFQEKAWESQATYVRDFIAILHEADWRLAEKGEFAFDE